jgi:twitching motility two-component system response regulator PilG
MSMVGNGTASISPGVKLLVKGLTPQEKQLLQGLVRLSERDTRQRALRIELLGDNDEREADVVLVDTQDAAAMAWARHQAWLAKKPVIWIDAPVHVPSGHTRARRPLQWPVLPVLLTRAMDALPVARTATPSAAAHARRPMVLVVDDSTIARTQLRSLLAMHECDAQEAADVGQAMSLLGGRRFDCVFMDVLMPGADGYDGCRQAKAQSRGDRAVPVVMLTSKTSPFDRIRGKMAGCDAYLAKPVSAADLEQVLAQFVPGSRPLRSHPHPKPMPGAARALPAAG